MAKRIKHAERGDDDAARRVSTDYRDFRLARNLRIGELIGFRE
jgi:hypothetical protein